MINVVKSFLLTISAISLISCGAGISDYEEDLGDGYYFIGGGGYNYIYQSRDPLKKNIDTLIVLPKVEKYVFDDRYIYVEQHPDSSMIKKQIAYGEVAKAYRKFQNNKNTNSTNNTAEIKIAKHLIRMGMTDNNSIKDQELLMIVADSILKFNKNYQRILNNPMNFYVIDKLKGSILGPLNKTSYEIIKGRSD